MPNLTIQQYDDLKDDFRSWKESPISQLFFNRLKGSLAEGDDTILHTKPDTKDYFHIMIGMHSQRELLLDMIDIELDDILVGSDFKLEENEE